MTGFQDQAVGHRQGRIPCSQPLGLVGPESHRGEHALDDVGRTDVRPVRRGELVEPHQDVSIAFQAVNRLGVLIAITVTEIVELLKIHGAKE